MERKRKHAAHTKVVEIDVWDWKYSSGRAISEVKKISVLHLACDTISIEKHNEYRVLLLHLLCQKGSIMLYYDTYTKQHTLYQGSPTPGSETGTGPPFVTVYLLRVWFLPLLVCVCHNNKTKQKKKQRG